MNRINKYFEFLKESKSTRDFTKLENLKKYREELIEEIEEMGYVYNDHYTELSNKVNLTQKDLDDKYNTMQSHMKKSLLTFGSGWSVEDLKELFSKESNDLMDSDFIKFCNDSSVTSISGEIDYYLYRTAEILGFDKNQIILGGMEDVITNDLEERIIKYKYGQHKNPYGILLIKQNNLSVDDFLKLVYSDIYKHLSNDWYYDILYRIIRNKNWNRINNNVINILSESDVSNFSNYSIFENNKIFINIDDFIDDLNSEINLIEKDSNINHDDVISVLLEYLTDFKDSITITDDKEYLILFGDFK